MRCPGVIGCWQIRQIPCIRAVMVRRSVFWWVACGASWRRTRCTNVGVGSRRALSRNAAIDRTRVRSRQLWRWRHMSGGSRSDLRSLLPRRRRWLRRQVRSASASSVCNWRIVWASVSSWAVNVKDICLSPLVDMGMVPGIQALPASASWLGGECDRGGIERHRVHASACG